MINPVQGLSNKLSLSTHTALETDFYHYNCLNEHDSGWGCSYRCLQMIMSNLINRSIIEAKIPTLTEIQIGLAKIGDTIKESDIGSNKWIEPPDCGQYLSKEFNLDVVNVSFLPGDDFALLIEKIKQHLSVEQTPVMIDDTIYSYIIAGYYQSDNGDEYLLRFDPHFKENSDLDDYESCNTSSLPWNNCGVSWKRAEDVLYQAAIWLILFPSTRSNIN